MSNQLVSSVSVVIKKDKKFLKKSKGKEEVVHDGCAFAQLKIKSAHAISMIPRKMNSSTAENPSSSNSQQATAAASATGITGKQ